MVMFTLTLAGWLLGGSRYASVVFYHVRPSLCFSRTIVAAPLVPL